MPIHTPFWVVFGVFDPLNGTQYQPIFKRLNLRIIARFQWYITYADGETKNASTENIVPRIECASMEKASTENAGTNLQVCKS